MRLATPSLVLQPIHDDEGKKRKKDKKVDDEKEEEAAMSIDVMYRVRQTHPRLKHCRAIGFYYKR